MDCPDPFPWTSLFGVIGTLAGAIVGGWLGHWFASKQASEQRAYEDRTRFHSERQRLYADYLAAAIELRGTIFVLGDRHWDEGDDDITGDLARHQHALVQGFGRIEIVGSKETRKTATELFHEIIALRTCGGRDFPKHRDSVSAAVNSFKEAARSELGIDSELDA